MVCMYMQDILVETEAEVNLEQEVVTTEDKSIEETNENENTDFSVTEDAKLSFEERAL